jgi:hypothetical protein
MSQRQFNHACIAQKIKRFLGKHPGLVMLKPEVSKGILTLMAHDGLRLRQATETYIERQYEGSLTPNSRKVLTFSLLKFITFEAEQK